MSVDTTQQPIQPTAADIEVLKASHANMKTERDNLAAERDALRRERDGLAAQATAWQAERTTLTAERDKLKTDFAATESSLTELTNKTRERDVLDGLRGAFPGVEAATLRGAFIGAAESGKVERYPAEPAKVLPGLIEHVKTTHPTFTRQPVDGGGAPAKVETPASSGRRLPHILSIGAPSNTGA